MGNSNVYGRKCFGEDYLASTCDFLLDGLDLWTVFRKIKEKGEGREIPDKIH